MTKGAALALSELQARTLRNIVDRVLPGAEVWVFGSRATGRARPFSDVDLLITRPATLSWVERAELSDAFEASELPFRVDVVDAAGLAPGMADRVAAEKVALMTVAQATELDLRLAQHRLDPSGGGTLDELAARLGVRL